MKVEILHEAEEELAAAIEHYESVQPGLGLRLKEETRQRILWIKNNATVTRLLPKGYRRVNLKVFPYYIPYFIWSDTIWILALAHAHRRPQYWIKRRANLP